MTCTTCRSGETEQSFANMMFDREESIVIVKMVPAEVCRQCGEEFFNEEVTQKALVIAEDAVKRGSEVEIIRYAA